MDLLRNAKSLDDLRAQPRIHRRVVSDASHLVRDGPRRDGAAVGVQVEAGGSGAAMGIAEATKEAAALRAGDAQLRNWYAGSEDVQSQDWYEGHEFATTQTEVGRSRKDVAFPNKSLTPATGVPESSGLAKAVEDILLTRTQLRHQVETLRSSRSFLQSSFQDLLIRMRTTDLRYTDTDERPMGDTGASEPLRRASFTQSGTLQYQLPLLASELEAAKASQGAEQPALSFADAISQTLEDFERLDKQEKLFSTKLDELSNLEYRLNDKWRSLARDLEDPATATRTVQQLLMEGPVLQGPAASVGSATDLPSVVEQYFDRRGDIGVCIERQQELEEAYVEGLAEREFIADRGDPLDVSDEEFHANYADRRAYIATELQIAQQDAAELEQRCQNAGYDLAAYRTTRHSNTVSMPSPSEKPTTSYSPALNPIREIEPVPKEQRHTARQPGINAWLRGVNHESAETVDSTISRASESPLVEAAQYGNISPSPLQIDAPSSSIVSITRPSPEPSSRKSEQLEKRSSTNVSSTSAELVDDSSDADYPAYLGAIEQGPPIFEAKVLQVEAPLQPSSKAPSTGLAADALTQRFQRLRGQI